MISYCVLFRLGFCLKVQPWLQPQTLFCRLPVARECSARCPHAWSGFKASAKEGMGVPSRPVIKSRYNPWSDSPHLNLVPPLKSNGVMGYPLLSVSEDADGPLPRPSLPWQSQQFMLWKSSPPRLALSGDVAGSGGIGSLSPGFSSLKRGEKLLTYATRSIRCWRVSGFHEGIPLA